MPIALKHVAKGGIVSDVVVDMVGGTGITLIAAEREFRQARLMELSPAYCDVIVARWE